MDSILNSIKKMLPIPEEVENFDDALIMHINAVFLGADKHLEQIEGGESKQKDYGESGINLTSFIKLCSHGIEKCANCIHDSYNADVGFLHFQGEFPPLSYLSKR